MTTPHLVAATELGRCCIFKSLKYPTEMENGFEDTSNDATNNNTPEHKPKSKSKEYKKQRYEQDRQKRLNDPILKEAYLQRCRERSNAYNRRKKDDPAFKEKKKAKWTRENEQRKERKKQDPVYKQRINQIRRECEGRKKLEPGHTEKRNETRRKFREWDRSRRKSLSIGFVNAAITAAKKSALEKDLDFNLDSAEARQELHRQLLLGNCAATGVSWDMDPSPTPGLPVPFRPSLDRIVPALGYVLSNCRWVVWIYNRGKGPDTDARMLQMARSMVAQNSKGENIEEDHY